MAASYNQTDPIGSIMWNYNDFRMTRGQESTEHQSKSYWQIKSLHVFMMTAKYLESAGTCQYVMQGVVPT